MTTKKNPETLFTSPGIFIINFIIILMEDIMNTYQEVVNLRQLLKECIPYLGYASSISIDEEILMKLNQWLTGLKLL